MLLAPQDLIWDMQNLSTKGFATVEAVDLKSGYGLLA